MYDELIKKIRHCATDPMHCLSCGEDKDGRCFKRLMTQAADAIEELKKAVNFHKYNSEFWEDKYNSLADEKWIPVAERLPERGERVLCYCRANIFEVMKMRANGDWVHDVHHIYMHSFVTHWMPLQEPPKEET